VIPVACLFFLALARDSVVVAQENASQRLEKLEQRLATVIEAVEDLPREKAASSQDERSGDGGDEVFVQAKELTCGFAADEPAAVEPSSPDEATVRLRELEARLDRVLLEVREKLADLDSEETPDESSEAEEVTRSLSGAAEGLNADEDAIDKVEAKIAAIEATLGIGQDDESNWATLGIGQDDEVTRGYVRVASEPQDERTRAIGPMPYDAQLNKENYAKLYANLTVMVAEFATSNGVPGWYPSVAEVNRAAAQFGGDWGRLGPDPGKGILDHAAHYNAVIDARDASSTCNFFGGRMEEIFRWVQGRPDKHADYADLYRRMTLHVGIQGQKWLGWKDGWQDYGDGRDDPNRGWTSGDASNAHYQATVEMFRDPKNTRSFQLFVFRLQDIYARIGNSGQPLTTNDLIVRLAPVIYLHPNEKFNPMDPSEFISKSRFRHFKGIGSDQGVPNTVRDQRPPDQDKEKWDYNNDKSDKYYNVPVWYINKYGMQNGKNRRPRDGNRGKAWNMFLDYGGFQGQDGHGMAAGMADPNRGVPVFVDSLEQGGNMVLIRYWYFFGYNEIPGTRNVGMLGNHQGDWESIILRVNKVDGKISGATYKGHGKGTDVTNVPLENGRPVVFISMGTHASYPTVGTFHTAGVDKTARGGVRWETQHNLQPLERQPWKDFAGAWGSVGKLPHTTGPLGPWHKRWN